MDSKQLAMLGKVKQPSVTLSEVYDLISKQILLGKMAIESLKMQKEYCTLLKNAQDFTIGLTDKKISLLNELNKLREEQLKEFDEIRQQECNDIVNDINELDNPTYQSTIIQKQMDEVKTKQNTLIEKFNAIQSTLPDEKILDFYKVKPKLDRNPIGTCATELGNDDYPI